MNIIGTGTLTLSVINYKLSSLLFTAVKGFMVAVPHM
jgi:hypothetical protein